VNARSEAAIGRLETVETFEELFTANYAPLTRLIFHIVGDAGLAEELASEAFWKLHCKRPPTSANLAGWLYRTGLRMALDSLRKRKRREQYEARTPNPQPPTSPEARLQQIEQQWRVRQVLAAIKREQAWLLVLRSEGYTLGEIASILRLHQGSVGTYLARADAAFRKEEVKRYGERSTRACSAMGDRADGLPEPA
jgi:RNA polymerase sigma factor (sigma-70 family)